MHDDLRSAEALFRARDYQGCVATCQELLSAGSTAAALPHLLGVALVRAGQTRQGALALEGALARTPGDLTLRVDTALALAECGEIDQAVAALAEGARHHPGNPDLAARLARLLTEHGRHADAQRVLGAALSACPYSLELRGLLAAELAADLQISAALPHLRCLLALCPDQSPVYGNIGVLLQSAGRVTDAITAYRRATQINRDNHVAQVNLGTALMTEGAFAAGFIHYEHRLELPDMRLPPAQLRRWRGESPAGEKLLVTAEQGYGDLIQFARFLPLLTALGAEVWLDCPAEMKRLFAPLPGLSGVVSHGDPLPAVAWAIPLLSLPVALGSQGDLRTASIPYLKAPAAGPSLPDSAHGKADSRPKIGLMWSGRPAKGELFIRRALARRSCPLDALSALWRLPDYRWYSLQQGAATAELAGKAPWLTDLSPMIADFADSAFVIAQLDLVITIDTAMAHLAGAMARPLWLMLSEGQADYRWNGTAGTSPWYPDARLFRAGTKGWPGLAAEMAVRLQEEFK